jgi:carbonic anhydrase
VPGRRGGRGHRPRGRPAAGRPRRDQAKTSLTPDEALALLRQGNERFLADLDPPHEGISSPRRLEIARGQTPFCVLVGCSDSRVSPEILFERGLGELFIVRNAGNTVDTAELGSIEYAVAVLGVPLIVVMGHERCGAVAAAVELVERNATFPGSVGEMIEPIVPAVLEARTKVAQGGGDLLDAAGRANVSRVCARLRTSQAVLTEPLRAGRVKVVGARYDPDDGHVDFFDRA